MVNVIWRQSDMQANLSKLYFLREDFSSHVFVTNEVSGKTEITFLKKGEGQYAYDYYMHYWITRENSYLCDYQDLAGWVNR